ncbi:tetratricopeptide repeat protein [Micromonospora sp. NPDC003197]
MSSGLDDLLAQAHDLVAAGDLAGAQELLGDVLSNADPRPGHASPDLAEAASLQARVLVTLGEPHSARGWAAFAYAAATRLYSPTDQRTVAAAATLAAVLHRVGNYARAARLYQDVIIELTATDGPESLRVLAAHADLATVEYAQGECEVARERMADAWEMHREVYGDAHLSGIKMLARLGAMQRDCGHFTEAHEHLALARELCRTNLPADHPLAIQVAALARAAANPDHVCAEPAPAATVPAPRVSLDAAADWPVDEPGYAPPAGWADSTADSAVEYEPAEPALPPAVPPLVGAAPATVPPLVGGDSAGDHSPAPDSGSRIESDGVYRVRNLPEVRRTTLPVPVPIPPPPQQPSRRRLSIVLAGLTVVLLGTAAVIAGFTLVDDAEPESTGPAATTPPPGPGATDPSAAPPSGVALRDNRDNVSLSWVYPAGSEGPVIVSGGRAGQEARAFKELPAGRTSYTVPNLSRSNNYCFTIAIVYSVDVVARSEPVCTTRSVGSPTS